MQTFATSWKQFMNSWVINILPVYYIDGLSITVHVHVSNSILTRAVDEGQRL